ncbi:hypothetical protein [Streptomyces iconiensis]|uniref:Necrosis inducing protein (NPP1) n=1 Tax=Streptomyces iconiensis TaxID=1384038 RepID=A0ABT7A474_9ACTN|nr:hypothetical protein [Streptomyces iconiensis]MDJ1136101.1 hypothetical protein [Streptomyces iconiensis]
MTGSAEESEKHMFRMHQRAAVLAAATMTGALLLTACGSGGEDGGGSGDSGKKPDSLASDGRKADGAKGKNEADIGTLNGSLKEGGAKMQDFAKASAPEWNFARANNNDPCWPENPFDENGKPKPGGEMKFWPDSDGGCAEHGGDFPTFWTGRKCTADEIRITYSMYQATSGFKSAGHPHDFEHIDVIWKKNGSDWTRSDLWLSQHSGHEKVSWKDAESWNADRGSAGKGLEFPRVFVGYGAHALFNDQEVGLKDIASATNDNEYRQADYPAWSDEGGGLVEVHPDGDMYKKFDENDGSWGGTADPSILADTMCDDEKHSR